MSDFKKLTIEEIYARLKTLAAEGKKLQIICHISPDGDCIGSAFAMKRIYERMGGRAEAICNDPAPKYLRFIMSEDLKSEADEDAVFCALDVSNMERLGCFGYLTEKLDFMIDHHSVGTPFADGIVIGTAAATGEILVELYKLQREELGADHTTAMNLYAAISSDTGSFKYQNTTEATLTAVSDIIDDVNSNPDLDAAEIARLLHDIRSKKAILATAIALKNLRYAYGDKLAYTTISQAEMDEAGIEEGDAGCIVDITRSIEDVEVGLTIKEKNGAYKLSSRSNNYIDVAAVCAKLGGGGHIRAAGVTIQAHSMEEAVKIALDAFGKECFT